MNAKLLKISISSEWQPHLVQLSVIILFMVNKISLEEAQGSIMMEFQPFVLSRNVILLLLYLKGANASKEAST